jgi:hypothetical protein
MYYLQDESGKPYIKQNKNRIQHTNSLSPIIWGNASPSRITAAAGTKLAGASSLRKSLSYTTKELYSRFIFYKKSFLLSSFTQNN